jgi:glucose/arabinose dehydrogenase
MLRWVGLLAAAFTLTSCFGGSIPKPASLDAMLPASVEQTDAGSLSNFYQQEVLAEGLNVPWELAFAPDGRIFVTERGGLIRVIQDGQLQPEPVYRAAGAFVSRGEGGLLGMELDSDFEQNRRMYVYFSYEEASVMKNKVVRLVERNGRFVDDQILIDNLPGQRNHDGGRIRIGPDGKLYVTVGDAQDPARSQDMSTLAGKILRMNLDGSVPHDNPFSGSLIYSLGHRNPQGLAWHPITGSLFSSEHGQSAHDEINMIEPGVNYGWPLIQGDETETNSSSGKPGGRHLEKPLLHSGKTTWAPSGMTFVTQGPWTNQLLVSNLRGSQVLRIELGSDYRTVHSHTAMWNEYGRIRNIVEGPDGSFYLLTNNRDGRGTPHSGDDKIIVMKRTK